MNLPIAETFHSIQGEGVWAGTPMFFVRLAGCNVGKYKRDDAVHSICTTVDGQEFLCDTDYHRSESIALEDFVKQLVPEPRICITGGEPFLHGELLEQLILRWPQLNQEKNFHIETSGTLPLPAWVGSLHNVWITCCPKQGIVIPGSWLVDEWKFLVGPGFRDGIIEEIVGESDAPVFLQPINTVTDVDTANLAHCVEILQKHPRWRLSPQLHKFVHLR